MHPTLKWTEHGECPVYSACPSRQLKIELKWTWWWIYRSVIQSSSVQVRWDEMGWDGMGWDGMGLGWVLWTLLLLWREVSCGDVAVWIPFGFWDMQLFSVPLQAWIGYCRAHTVCFIDVSGAQTNVSCFYAEKSSLTHTDMSCQEGPAPVTQVWLQLYRNVGSALRCVAHCQCQSDSETLMPRNAPWSSRGPAANCSPVMTWEMNSCNRQRRRYSVVNWRRR